MNFKRTLGNLALSGLLLAGGILAYADGEVTLNAGSGKTISWDDFVNALKYPDTVEGDTTAYIAANPGSKATKDYQSAYNANEAAQSALATATSTQKDKADAKATADSAVEDAQDAIDAQQTIIDGKKEELETANEAVTTAEASLKTAQDAYIKTYQDQLATDSASLKTKETQLATLEQTLSGYNDKKENLEGQLGTAQDQLTSAENALKALPRKKGTVTWLANILSAATKWHLLVEGQEVKDLPPMYVKVSETKNAFGTVRKNLNYSFITPDDATDWNKCTTSDEYISLFTTEEDPIDLSKITYIYVYMGSQYAALNSDNANLSITKPSDPSDILPNIVDKIGTLANTSTYQGPTDEYENQDAADSYDAQIKSLTAKVNKLSIQIYGAHLVDGKLPYDAEEETDGLDDQINATQTQINTVNGDIKTLKETTIPNSQSALDNAVMAVEEGTAISADITAAKSDLDTANGNVTKLEGEIKDTEALIAPDSELQQTLTEKLTAQEEAASELTAADTALASAKTAADAAATKFATAETALETAASNYATQGYQKVNLNADVNVTTGTGADYAGTIYGKGHLINITPGVNLFDTFTGTINDAAINGAIASIYGAGKYYDVAVWTGAAGRFYNAEGAKADYTDFGAFGYALSTNQYFGVNFSTGKLVAVGAAPSAVFMLTEYSAPAGLEDTNPVEKVVYAQLAAKNSSDMLTMANNKAVAYAVPTNQFAKSANNAVEGLGLANVYYGANNTCELAVIEDREDLYCPATIQAQEVEFSRVFNSTYNSVCVPFQLNAANLSDQIASICTYEKVDFDTRKFWFMKKEGTIAGNTPVLIVMKEGAKDVKFTINNVAIAKTNNKQIVTSNAINDETCSYGTFKTCSVDEFAGNEYAGYIYGLQNNGNFIAGSANAKFPALRMVIGTNKAVNPGKSAAKRAPGQYDVMGIGIHDEDGHDITDTLTTGINDVVSDSEVASFSIVGGQGEIIINSEADYGEVAIYTIDGSVVAIADVIEGTTTVNVQKGLYIVMGKKVMVK